MLAIEVEYLIGRSVATNREIRSEPEWPAHPQRLFAALVAAYKEMDFGDAERAALEWLEELGPPHIHASQYSVRTAVQRFVPINDSNAQFVVNKKKGTVKYHPQIDAGIAVRRFRAPERFFPTIVPDDPVVQYIWPEANEDERTKHSSAINRLTSFVGYLGHSTSPVRVSLADEVKSATLIPTDEASATNVDDRLRTVVPGRLKLLEDMYAQSQACSRRIEAPDVPRTGYVDRLTSKIPRPVFGGPSDWFVFERVAGKSLPLHSSLALTSSVRRALCEKCDDSVATLLSGHNRSDGTPMDQPHVVYLPLAHVGHKHADGAIHGFAIVLPRDLDWGDRKTILQGIGRLQKVWNNNSAAKSHLAFDWHVSPATGETRKKTLHARAWTRKARCWATVTPVVFGHFLRKLDDSRASRIVSECCTAIGLPKPKHVRISTTSLHDGVPVSAWFPSLSARGKPVWTSFRNGRHQIPRKLPDGTAVRMRYHVAVEFEEEVFGPVILGAGRYFGMGLCKPLFG